MYSSIKTTHLIAYIELKHLDTLFKKFFLPSPQINNKETKTHTGHGWLGKKKVSNEFLSLRSDNFIFLA